MAQPSIPPAGVPNSDNQKYVIIALVLLLGTCGLVAWRMKGDTTTTGTVVTATAPTVLPPIVRRDQPDEPPPPEAIPTTKPTSNGTGGNVAANSGGPSGCTPKCGGSAGEDLVSALAQRGRMARRCYEKELANDPKLTARVSVNVHVGTNGAVCSASASSGESPSIAACVGNFYRSGTYPPAKGGCADVTVPLNFVPGK